MALGLKPWAEFAAEIIKDRPLSLFDGRLTGRSTKMIIEAIFESQNQYVCIAGCHRKHSKILVAYAKILCERLGLDKSRILVASDGISCPVFVDHTA